MSCVRPGTARCLCSSTMESTAVRITRRQPRCLPPWILRLVNFALKGLHKLAQGKGDASCASVAVALGRRGFSVSILFHGNASALKGRNTRCPCLRRPFKARAGVVISYKLLSIVPRAALRSALGYHVNAPSGREKHEHQVACT
jgi:hypothetical protein